MAVVVVKNPSYLKLRFDCSLSETTGKSIIKTKSYSNVKHNALNDDVYEVGASIASLQVNDLLEVQKVDNTTLAN
ncbi:MAG: DUF1659 domain-containing protein [Peptostreptococcaceae bacterium]